MLTAAITPTTAIHFLSQQLHLKPLFHHPLSLLNLNQYSFPSTFSISPASKMEEVILELYGKSDEENELAKCLKKNNTLNLPDSSPVSIQYHSKELKNDDAFRIKPFMDALSTECFGRLFIYSPRLPSTHDVVSHNFKNLPLGVVCVADAQTKGRGRTQNVWESPKGCLMFSFTLQMKNGRVLPFVQYVASLAMTEAINFVSHQTCIPYLDVKIKWPNDLYLDGLKVGGVLCTSSYRDKKFDVSVGIGLNVGNEKPTICLNTVVQKLTSSSRELSREDILSAFFNKFENFYQIFINEGFQPFEELYYKTWLHSGQRVIVQEMEKESEVTIVGLTETGYLLAVSEDGETCELHPDGNSLDFLKGLVRRKLT